MLEKTAKCHGVRVVGVELGALTADIYALCCLAQHQEVVNKMDDLFKRS